MAMVFNNFRAMADTRAARASRRASGRAAIELGASRVADRATVEPWVEHPGEDDDYVDGNKECDPRNGFCEDAESSHPSQPAFVAYLHLEKWHGTCV